MTHIAYMVQIRSRFRQFGAKLPVRICLVRPFIWLITSNSSYKILTFTCPGNTFFWPKQTLWIKMTQNCIYLCSSFIYPERLLPTISHVLAACRSSSSVLLESVVSAPIKLPSSLNLLVIARVSISSVHINITPYFKPKNRKQSIQKLLTDSHHIPLLQILR